MAKNRKIRATEKRAKKKQDFLTEIHRLAQELNTQLWSVGMFERVEVFDLVMKGFCLCGKERGGHNSRRWCGDCNKELIGLDYESVR